jgi:DNA-3-methyladenine glycosylase I
MAISSCSERCPWCGSDPLYVAYHDKEWGVPCHDERTLFEFLILEGAQAGLSWITILRKRGNYRRAFDNFDPGKIAGYGDMEIARLLGDAGIVRNRAKITAAVDNARATLALYNSGSSLNDFFWQFVDGRPLVNHWRSVSEVPIFTAAATALSNEMKRRGFRFVGPTVIYSHMQATGMVNDHLVTCPRHHEVGKV